jgi:hypothetical protein
MPFESNLPAFTAIDQQWSAIIIGNGASRAVSDSFAYTSLYAKACSNEIARTPLPNRSRTSLMR